MKKLITIFVIMTAALFISTGASACWPYCGNSNNGDTINNYDNRSYDNSTTNTPTATATGGQGGNATIEKGAIKNKNVNKNTNVNINANKNANKNKNINVNKNTQGQLQGQAQGQMQGQTAHNEGVSNSVVINEAETKREHIGGSAFTAKAGTYGDKYNYGAEFAPVAELTRFKKSFSFAAAYEDYGRKFGEDKCKTTGHSYNGRHEDDPSESILVTPVESFKTNRKFIVVGFLTVKSVEDGTDSFMVMQKVVLSAALMQGDVAIVTNEGASFKPKSSGWGIGTFFSGGQVADHGNRGNATAGGGGTGYSSTTSELVTMPWMTVQVIKYVD